MPLILLNLAKGQPFTFGGCTDHKPLIELIKGAEKAENTCLTRLREELTGWDIHDVWYRASKSNAGPDALSRKPAGINLLTE